MIKISTGYTYHIIIEQSPVELDFVFLLVCVIWAQAQSLCTQISTFVKWEVFSVRILSKARIGEFCSVIYWESTLKRRTVGETGWDRGKPNKKALKHECHQSGSCFEARELAFWTPGHSGTG